MELTAATPERFALLTNSQIGQCVHAALQSLIEQCYRIALEATGSLFFGFCVPNFTYSPARRQYPIILTFTNANRIGAHLHFFGLAHYIVSFDVSSTKAKVVDRFVP